MGLPSPSGRCTPACCPGTTAPSSRWLPAWPSTTTDLRYLGSPSPLLDSAPALPAVLLLLSLPPLSCAYPRLLAESLTQDMPVEMSQVVMKCWDKDPEARPSFSHLLAPLRHMHETFSPSSKMSSGSSSSSLSSSSTSSTIVSYISQQTRNSPKPSLFNARSKPLIITSRGSSSSGFYTAR
eukprot:753374-Hanusia_phi.AAC.14